MEKFKLNSKIAIRSIVFSIALSSLVAIASSVFIKGTELRGDVLIHPGVFLGLAVTNSLWVILYVVFLLEIYNRVLGRQYKTLKILKILSIIFVIFSAIFIPSVLYRHSQASLVDCFKFRAGSLAEEECAVQLAVQQDDISKCKIVQGGNSEESCILGVAKIKGDKAICDNNFSENAEYRSLCYSEIARKGQLGPEDCKIVKSLYEKNQCLASVAMYRAAYGYNSSLCEVVVNNGLKEFIGQPYIEGDFKDAFSQFHIDSTVDFCYQKLAEMTGDIEICNLIKNTESNTYTNRPHCIEILGGRR